MQAAKDWHEHPAYQTEAQHLLRGADCRTVIVEGIDPAAFAAMLAAPPAVEPA